MADTEMTLPSRTTMWLLTTLQMPKIGVASVRKLALQMRDTANLQDGFSGEAPESLQAQFVHSPIAVDRAHRILEACRAHSISVISMSDDAYPSSLRMVRDAPPILYVRGSVAALQIPGCAVVGTREASEDGERIAGRIAKLLVELGLSVVSGLALGIDAAAHAGAISASGVTIAVLANGLDKITPVSNKGIAAQLLQLGGALVSEHEPGVPPRPAEFVRRNRIQSGMSLCSIVVESGAVGGSIHQARFTKEQGHALFAVLPEIPEASRSRFNGEGGRYLVRELGAVPINSVTDLENHLKILIPSDRLTSPHPSSNQFNLFL